MTIANYMVPISVKGILFEKSEVWLRENERQEWELPGGKLDMGEQPEAVVVREMQEELGFLVKVADIIGAHLYTIASNDDEARGVLVVSYLCKLLDKVGGFELIGEASPAEFACFKMSDLNLLNMPQFYKIMIEKAYKKLLL